MVWYVGYCDVVDVGVFGYWMFVGLSFDYYFVG